MKTIILSLAILLASLTSFSQSISTYAHGSMICSKDATASAWGTWSNTNARFYLYKTGGVATKVEAYFDSRDSFTGITTFTVYAESKVQEDNGFAYYLYVYYSNDLGTSKTYDKTEFIKIKDQVKENQSTIQLYGYKNTTDWAWLIDEYTTY